MQYKNVTRRFFLKTAGSLSFLFSTDKITEAAERIECMSASSHSKETMLAISDVIVPGAKNSSDKSPGAADACSLDIMYDPFFGLEKYIAFLVISIDWSSLWRFGSLYKNIDFEKRTYILQVKEENGWFFKKGFKGIIILAKLAFYGGYKNNIGMEYIGFPGANPGYHDFSHEKLFAKEKTVDGNLK
ncbi:MAG: hypothetical protein AABY58_01295 [Nitrospirota bacterium]|mgnify:FL=1